MITPSKILSKCPKCHSDMELQDFKSETDTFCGNCDYSEPKGSSHFFSYLGKVLKKYCEKQGFNSPTVGGESVNFNACFSPEGLLPVLMSHAKQLAEENGHKFDAITTVPSSKAILGQRTILAKNKAIPNFELIAISTIGTIHTLNDLTIKLDGRDRSEKALNFDYLLGSGLNIDLKENIGRSAISLASNSFVSQQHER